MYQSGSMTMGYLGLSGVSFAFTNGGSSVYSGISAPTGSISSFTSSDTIGFAYDADAGTLTVYRNNVSSLVYSGLTGTWFPAQGANGAASGIFNFGQRPFAYTAPSGFKALCTQNLPTPTIGATSTTQAGDYFNPVLYTGNGNATAQAITGTGFQPDWVWIKSRSNTYVNLLFDAVRGAGKQLISELTNAETTVANFVSFDSDGFTVNANGGASSYNANGATYVAWQWKANGAGSSNTAGSITSTVSANTTSGFSVVTFAAAANSTVGHGLGVAPSMVVVKSRTSGTAFWLTYHVSTGPTGFLAWNTTDAFATNSTVWNNTAPTSTVFTIGSGFTNASYGNCVAYCFAEVPGYSRFGSYTGNGSTDGPFVFTGFRPRYVLIKSTAGDRGWGIFDSARGTFNVNKLLLEANSSGAEIDSANYQLDFLSNGFKIRTDNQYMNANGSTYIFAAFAENPFKYALAR
jgi:hypothetical protein